jgi:lambda family phage portal protein
LTWLDSTIGWFAPEAGARRLQARKVMQVLAGRAYEGASAGRHTEGWITASSDASTEIAGAMTRTRDRARDLVRNNPYAARAVKAHTANAIGSGIVPRSIETVDKLFARWAEQADADGRLDFYGLQTLGLRTVIESGEVLIRRLAPSGDYEVPLQLQMLECDFIDTSKDVARAPSSTLGGYARQGIQYDARGKRLGYWLFRNHPGATDLAFRNSLESTLVPADEILHIYDPLRVGQGRGITWFAPALIKLKDLADYEESELVRKKIEACLAGFVTTDDDLRTLGQGKIAEDGKRIEEFVPGMVQYLKPGESFNTFQPSFAQGGAYQEYMRVQLHAIACALDLTYELLTGDLSQVNFSSARMGLQQFRYRVQQVQSQILIPCMLLPIWRWFCELAAVKDQVRLDADGRVPVVWAVPKFESVQPLDDAKEIEMRIRNGTLSWPQAVAAQGMDPQDQLNEIKAWNKKFDDAGIVLDTDPRKVTKAGNAQVAAAGAAPAGGSPGRNPVTPRPARPAAGMPANGKDANPNA